MSEDVLYAVMCVPDACHKDLRERAVSSLLPMHELVSDVDPDGAA